jgi:hypothetical protein
MKRLLIMLFLVAPFTGVTQNCQSPMPAGVFRQKLNQMAMQPNDAQKLQFAKSLLPGSCLLSSQVKDMAVVFAGDYYRYEFARRAWRHTYDPVNFFDVYDAFAGFSSALRLYDFVNKQDPSPPPGPPPGNVPPKNWYPDLAYPLPAGYSGSTGCALPLADNDFEVLAGPVVQQKTDAAIRTEALKLMVSNCLCMGQAMKIASLFDLESNRLSFLKEVFPKLYDLENYTYATELFTHIPYKNDWLAHCPTVLDPVVGTPPPATPVCEVTEAEFADIRKSIDNVSVNSTKLTLAKQIVSTKKCFTVKQIAAIMNLFYVESSKLDLALYSYDFCVNTGDYYQLTESLNTTSSKDKLLEFISSKK